MSEQLTVNVEHAFDPEARKAQTDFNEYIASRPYEDQAGKIHNPDNGKFINPDKFFDHYDSSQSPLNTGYETPSYEDMSVTETAKALAKAEFDGDNTKVEDLSDILADKLAREENTIVSSRDGEHNNDRSENLWNRVMGVKDAELARLSGEKTEVSPEKTFSEETKMKLEKIDKENLGKLTDAIDLRRDRGGVGSYGAKLQDLEKGIRNAGEVAGYQGEKLEKFVADKVAEIDARDLDILDSKQTEVEKKSRMDAIRDEISAIKKGQAQRWADRRVKDGNTYDPEFEQTQDDRVKELMMEAYGTDDPEDPRVTKAIKKLDDDEAALSERIKKAGVEYEDDEDQDTEVVKIVEPIQPTKPEKVGWFERNKRKVILVGALGAAALAGILGFSAREDKGLDLDIGNHGKDIEQVVEVDEAEDALREAGVDVHTRHEIASNFEQAEDFFNKIRTRVGAEEFKKLEKAYTESVDGYMKGGMTKSAAETLTQAEMDVFFANAKVASLR